jgi:hypothetical protein
MTLASSNLNTINIVLELKQHHEDVVSNLKQELAENFIETLKTMNMSEETENQNPNVQSYMTPANYIAPTVGHEQTMFSAVQTNQDPILQQLLAQMAHMQEKIENLTLTNNGSKKKSRTNKNSKIRHHQRIKSIRRRADSGEDIVGRVDVVTTGAGTATKKKWSQG